MQEFPRAPQGMLYLQGFLLLLSWACPSLSGGSLGDLFLRQGQGSV